MRHNQVPQCSDDPLGPRSIWTTAFTQICVHTSTNHFLAAHLGFQIEGMVHWEVYGEQGQAPGGSQRCSRQLLRVEEWTARDQKFGGQVGKPPEAARAGPWRQPGQAHSSYQTQSIFSRSICNVTVLHFERTSQKMLLEKRYGAPVNSSFDSIYCMSRLMVQG
jgi:hypothetical protein